MTSDLALQDAEDEFNEAREWAICHDAAILVIAGYSRDLAIKKATEIFGTQQEAENDPTGTIGTLAEAQSPNMHAGRDAQVKAIAQELYSEYFE